jgi:hypothetical protein
MSNMSYRQRGSGGTALLILHLCIKSCAFVFTSREQPPNSTEEVGCAPEAVWTLWKWDKSLAHAGNQTPDIWLTVWPLRFLHLKAAAF